MHSPILVLAAHPAPQRAGLYQQLLAAARSTAGVLVRELYELYPDFDVDAGRERRLLEQARTIVFLHPFRWYGMPSLMKEWMEATLAPGWAYGEGPCALRGKRLWLVTTTGSALDAYRPGGLHGRPFADFLAPYEQTAALCGMAWQAPLVLHGAAGADEAAILDHVSRFKTALSLAAPAAGAAHGT